MPLLDDVIDAMLTEIMHRWKTQFKTDVSFPLLSLVQTQGMLN
ncbi:hypothetical protein [uncultured Shewanella sp.]|nr:hypothetical protein [uncultured Shewanella sp.]